MHVYGGRRRLLLVPAVVAAVLAVASAGLTTASADATDTRPGTTAGPGTHAAGALQQEVDAIHGTGTVGVLAEVGTPDTRRRAHG